MRIRQQTVPMTGTFAGYGQIAPIEECIPAARQSARRHYGVHPYFTRRPHNVVRKYILRYSHEGDLVLDPFGGSGVTAIEAFLENRTGVQNDINPLANFIASGIADLTRGSIHEYETGFEDLRRQCEGPVSLVCAASEGSANEIPQRVVLPENVRLPSNSDVERYHDLFSSRQLCALAVVKDAIGRLRTGYVRSAMLLAWSATLTKLNRTFLSAEGRAESRGGSSIFGSAQEFAGSSILGPLGRLLENEEFGVRSRHALRFEQQIAKVLVAAPPVDQRANVPIDGFHHAETHFGAAVI